MAKKRVTYAEKVERYGKAKLAEWKHRYYMKHREAYKAKVYAYRAEHKEHHKKVCREYQRKMRRDNPEWEYNYALRKRYGITIEDYKAILLSQGNACAICLQSFDATIGIDGHNKQKRRGVVDHCHDSDIIRGILCDLCNVMLGSARDDKSILTRASAYLDRAERQKRIGA